MSEWRAPFWLLLLAMLVGWWAGALVKQLAQ